MRESSVRRVFELRFLEKEAFWPLERSIVGAIKERRITRAWLLLAFSTIDRSFDQSTRFQVSNDSLANALFLSERNKKIYSHLAETPALLASSQRRNDASRSSISPRVASPLGGGRLDSSLFPGQHSSSPPSPNGFSGMHDDPSFFASFRYPAAPCPSACPLAFRGATRADCTDLLPPLSRLSLSLFVILKLCLGTNEYRRLAAAALVDSGELSRALRAILAPPDSSLGVEPRALPRACQLNEKRFATDEILPEAFCNFCCTRSCITRTATTTSIAMRGSIQGRDIQKPKVRSRENLTSRRTGLTGFGAYTAGSDAAAIGRAA